jgi:predicted GIY-YIG superfamily endonuclease
MAEKQLDLFARPAPRQLWLLQFTNPLVTRFGKEFFASIPKSPGIYKMRNERGDIIYVGKAKSLRDRLRSYTHASAENSSRKVLRLVHSVRQIEWEELASERAALLRENQLLRTLRPFFNVVNTSPHTYLFAHLDLDEKGIRIHLAMKPDPAYPEVYGAFKGLGLCYRAHKALLRLLWLSFNECRNGFELPGALTGHRKLAHYRLPLPESLAAGERLKLFRSLKRLFNGTSNRLLGELIERLLAREELAPFLSGYIQADIDTALEFYERCARRNRKLKREFGLGERLVAQDQLDDLIVMMEKR